MKNKLNNCYICSEDLGQSQPCSLVGSSVSVGPYRLRVVNSVGVLYMFLILYLVHVSVSSIVIKLYFIYHCMYFVCFVYTYGCICVCAFMCLLEFTCAHVFVCVCACMRVRVHVHVYDL